MTGSINMPDGVTRRVVLACLEVVRVLLERLSRSWSNQCLRQEEQTNEQQCVPQCRGHRAGSTPAGHDREHLGEQQGLHRQRVRDGQQDANNETRSLVTPTRRAS